MQTENRIAALRERLAAVRATGGRIALVPTMGALHAGHLALVDEAVRRADTVVVSVFVNPLQFGPAEDFTSYPRTLDDDAKALAGRGASVLFAPSAAEMYRSGDGVTVMPAASAANFEGAIRPGHFSGVLTVVAKLFNIVQPHVAVFGRKDLQQLSVIRAMVTDLDFPIEIVAVDTVRETDGLALSSRNRYLDESERRSAAQIRTALLAAKAAFDAGIVAPEKIETAGLEILAAEQGIHVDYFTVVNESDFTRPEDARHLNSVVAAARLGRTRLIDNIQL